MEDKDKALVNHTKYSYAWILPTVIVLALVLLLAWFTLTKIEEQIKRDSAATLTSTLTITHETINIWFDERSHEILYTANLPDFKRLATKLLSENESAERNSQSTALDELREYMTLSTVGHQDHGFFLLSPEFINIASSRESNMGKKNLLVGHGDYLDRIFAGETVLTMPIRSDVPLPGPGGRLLEGLPTMFIGVPVSVHDKVIGALLVHINPSHRFTHIIQLARTGESGDTYAFDSSGILISESRFEDQLREIGLIEEGEGSILSLSLRDPGGNMLRGYRPDVERNELPFTLMAKSAIKNESGKNLEGYRDYRGVPVVGAWLWNEKLGFGLSAEVDVSEVYVSLNIIRRAVGFVIGLTMLLFSVLIVFVIIRNRKLDSEIAVRRRVENKLRLSRDLIDKSADAFYIIDPYTARFLDVNTCASITLGYSTEEFLKLFVFDISEGVDVSFWKAHVEELKVKREVTLEIRHIRKDKSTFPVEIRSSYIESAGKGYVVAVVRNTTKRIKAEEDLLRYHNIVDQAGDSLFILDAVTSSILEVNKQTCNLLGYSREQLLNMRMLDISLYLKDMETWTHCVKTLSIIEEMILETEHLTSGGTYVPVEFRAKAVSQEDRDYLVIVARDITERKEAEEQLRILSLVVDQSLASTIILDTNLCIKYVNPACVKSTGYSKDELVGENVKILRSDEHTDKFYDNIWKTAGTGKVWRGDVCSRRMDGTKIWELINISPVINQSGEVMHFVSVKVDDTERKRVEDLLKMSEKMLKEAQRVAQMGHWELDLLSNSLYWSDEIYRLFEIDPENFAASYEAFLDAIHPDDREMVSNAYTKSLEDKSAYDIVHRLLMKDGRIKYVHERCISTFDGDKPIRSLGTVQDITDISLAEEALRLSEAQQRLLLDSTAEAIYGIDLNGNCTFANKACVEMLGYACVDDLLGQNMHELIHHTRKDGSTYPVKECFIYDAFSNTKGSHVDDEVLWRKDNTSFDAEYWSYPIRAQGEGEAVGSVITFLDITKRKMFETEVIKAQKLESIGLLAGGIAHDFNNLLTSIFGNVDLAKQLTKPGEKIFERLDKVDIASRQAAALTQQLLTFSKGGEPVFRVVSVMDLAKESLEISLRGSHISGEFITTDDLLLVSADSGQLSQVLNNLVINAAQAMSDGGKVIIKCKNLRVESSSDPLLKQGNYVKISVQDNGCGISEEDLKRIFDPYFTTKDMGTGLGLATTYSIINNHGGMINVKSTVGRGTTFNIYLPALDDSKETNAKSKDKLL